MTAPKLQSCGGQLHEITRFEANAGQGISQQSIDKMFKQAQIFFGGTVLQALLGMISELNLRYETFRVLLLPLGAGSTSKGLVNYQPIEDKA